MTPQTPQGYKRGRKKMKVTGGEMRYYEIPIRDEILSVFAANLTAAQAEADRIYQVGHNAEFCFDPETCRKEHYHEVTCRCQECYDCYEAEKK